jgi:hypothetical protein
MKNTIKLIGIIAVVAVIGVFFAACGPDEDERVVVFINESIYGITVRCAGSTPEEFDLDGIQAAAWAAGDEPDSQKVTRVGKNIELTGWEIKGSGGSKAGIKTDNPAGYYYFRNDTSMELSVEQ